MTATKNDGIIECVRLWQIVLMAFAARFAALGLGPQTTSMLDTTRYLNAGDGLFENGVIEGDRVMPLYPVIAHITGGDLGLQFFDITMSVLLVAVLHRLAIEIFEDELAGLAAAAIAAVYPHFVFFSVVRLSEMTFLALVGLALLALYRRNFLLASILLVLSILTRPLLDLLAPLLIVWSAYVVHRLSLRETAVQVLKYALVYIALLTPWWIHNLEKYDTFVRLNLGDGLVLYLGNNPANTTGGGVNDTGTGHYEYDRRYFDSTFGTIADPVERNAALRQAAFAFVANHPGRFVELAWLKMKRFWRAWPYAKQYQRPWIIAASVLSYLPILFGSIAFVVLYGRKYFRETSLILGLCGYITLVHAVTIGSIRYRLPIEPYMILFTGFVLAQGLRRLGSGQRARTDT